MFMAVSNRLYGYVHFGDGEEDYKMEFDVINNPKFKKEQEKIERCISDLAKDRRPKRQLIKYWKAVVSG
jgi:hypothetical protein